MYIALWCVRWVSDLEILVHFCRTMHQIELMLQEVKLSCHKMVTIICL